MSRQITMEELDYNELKDRIAKANNEAAAARAELEAERKRPIDDRLNAAYTFIESSKEIIDYAVGNLSPEFSRGWPVAHISTLADLVDKVGHVTSRDQGRHQVWTAFTASVVDFDQRWLLASPKPQMTNAEIVDAAAAIQAQELAEKQLAAAREKLFKPALSSWQVLLFLGGGLLLLVGILLLTLFAKS